MNPYRLAVAALALATLLWGSTFTFMKVLVDALPPMYMLGYRFALTALILFLIFPRSVIAEFRRAVGDKHLLLFSFVNVGAIGLQTYGIQYTTASNAGFITAFSVVLVPLLKSLHFKARISRHVCAAVVVAVAGLYALSFGLAIPKSVNRGDFIVLLCAVFYGYYILLLEGIANRFSAATVLFVSFGVTAVACLGIGALTETPPAMAALLRGPVVLNMLGLVVFGSVIAYLLMAWGQRHVPAETAALVYTLEPLFAFVIAWAALGERLTGWQMAGAALVMAALVIGVRVEGGSRE